MSDPLIKVRSLRKAFPVREGTVLRKKVGEIVAVDDISFDVFEGETLGCVGGSGSGKSTLGRLILNLIRADTGSVRFGDAELIGLSPAQMRPYRKDLQIVFQDPLHTLNPRRTVAENVARSLLNFDIPKREAKERVTHLFDIVGLNPAHTNRYPHEFSGGQCQRIGIARALALEPRFLFLDEPVSALDVSIQGQILNLLKELQETLRLTYLFVSHDLKLVKNFSDRILVLYHGRAVEIGGSDAVYHQPKHPYTRTLLDAVLGLKQDDAWERVASQTGVLADDEDLESAMRASAAARTGCIYSGTCTEHFEPCATRMPELDECGAGHAVACHLYDLSRNDRNASAAAGGARRVNEHTLRHSRDEHANQLTT